MPVCNLCQKVYYGDTCPICAKAKEQKNRRLPPIINPIDMTGTTTPPEARLKIKALQAQLETQSRAIQSDKALLSAKSKAYAKVYLILEEELDTKKVEIIGNPNGSADVTFRYMGNETKKHYDSFNKILTTLTKKKGFKESDKKSYEVIKVTREEKK